MSIPEGICVDLETSFSSRIPDDVRPKGKKRLETRLLEIGATCWHKHGSDYQALVNPLYGIPLQTPEDMFSAFRDMYQRPDATIDFWSSVLARRENTLTSDMCNGMDPQIWKRCTVKNKAKDFIRWFNHPELGPDFKTEKEALDGLLQYTDDCGETTWLAHNGLSFDFKILEGAAERSGTSISSIEQVDTLRIFKKNFNLEKRLNVEKLSYSQPKLYASLGLGVYNAHVAIDDARALAKICQKLSQPTKLDETTTFTDTHKIRRKTNNIKIRKAMTSLSQPVMKLSQPVMKLKGIGPKSRDILARHNIRTISDLNNQFNSKGVEWLRRTLPRGVRWRMVTQSLATVALCINNK